MLHLKSVDGNLTYDPNAILIAFDFDTDLEKDNAMSDAWRIYIKTYQNLIMSRANCLTLTSS